MRARAIRGRFDQHPQCRVQGFFCASGIASFSTKPDLDGQNRLEVLGEEDEQDFEMSPMESASWRTDASHNAPEFWAVRHEDSTFPIRRLRLVGGSNRSQSSTVAWIEGWVCRMILLWRTECLMSSLHIPMRKAVQKHTPKQLMAPNGKETTVTVDVTPDFSNFGMVLDQNIGV